MKKSLLLIPMVLTTIVSIAQDNSSKNIGIGTRSPNSSAILDLSASDKGLLIPRLSSLQKESILNPAKGLLIFQTDSSRSGFYFFNDGWKPLGTTAANSIADDPYTWSLTGNSNTNPAFNFIGTTDNQPLLLKTNNQRVAFFDNTGFNNLFIGKLAGISSAPTGTPGTANSGSYNIGFGASSLTSLTTGFGNVAIGFGSLANLSTGSDNLSVGNSALYNNLSGSNNVALGGGSMYGNKGSSNTALGAYSLANNIFGSGNIAIGDGAGGGSSGSNNVFLGFNAGYSEASSDKLYIAGSSTTTPLIYGDFSAKFVSIGDVPVDKRNSVASSGQYSLIVEKGILSEKLKVALKASTDWADYVFEPEYKANMLSLEEVEAYTIKNKHLPNVPSAEELVEKGLDFNETSRIFMEKIEELTLYLIELNKEIKKLKAENEILKRK